MYSANIQCFEVFHAAISREKCFACLPRSNLSSPPGVQSGKKLSEWSSARPAPASLPCPWQSNGCEVFKTKIDGYAATVRSRLFSHFSRFLNDFSMIFNAPDALWPLWRLSRFVYTPLHPSPHPGAAHASCLRGHPWRICARTLAWCLGRTGNAGPGIRAFGRKLWEHQTLFGRRTSKVRWC